MLITSLVIIVTLPLLNAWLHPKLGDKVVEVDPPSTATRRRPAAPTTCWKRTPSPPA